MASAVCIFYILVAAYLGLGPAQAPAAQRPDPAIADAGGAQTPENDVSMQLFSEAMLGDVAGIQKALAAGALVNALSDSGSTPLALAALHGHVNAVNALVAARADIDATDKDGAT